jgi:hypothetical protein
LIAVARGSSGITSVLTTISSTGRTALRFLARRLAMVPVWS